jgi:thymidylate synthase (FAD)
MQVILLSHTPNPEQAIIDSAAVCWKSVPHERILHHIIKVGHWTPLEFAVFNFRIQGVSRALTHQLVRKRAGVAFCQESQRYVKYEDGFDYVIPESIRESTMSLISFNDLMNTIQEVYGQLLDDGVPAEDARFLLPNACCTNIDMTINYHALIDLCKERLCSRAQWEIRGMAEELKARVAEVSLVLAEYLQPKCYWLKHCPEAKTCGRWADRIQSETICGMVK